MNDGVTSATITSRQEEHDALRFVSAEAACPYLDGLSSRNEVYRADHLDGAIYERLMNRFFRRSGRLVYRPRCRGCVECRPLRVPVDAFVPTRSMRRVWRRNTDLEVDRGEPRISDEKYEVFTRYLDGQHDTTMSRSYECFRDFLYDSPTETVEYCYRLGQRLVGVSLADRLPSGYSSVYMYFDPDFASRSLGTYSVLWEIEQCRQECLPFYFLGYFVADSKAMAYKSRFRPNEVLAEDDNWVTFRE